MTVKILIVDDHPSMIEGYKIILSYNDLGYDIETTAALNCQSAYETLIKYKENYFDLVFLDYSLPPFEKEKIYSGQDLALIFKEKSPKTKIVILTSHTEALLIYKLIRKIAPEGLLIKSDFSADELILAFGTIQKGNIYHSATVKEITKKMLEKDKNLDPINREIIMLISQGYKTNSLPNLVHLSLSAVEKRKRQILDYFGITKGNDEDMLREARKNGLI